eukprot:gene7934-8130_t
MKYIPAVADMMVMMLVGKATIDAGCAALKQQLKGKSIYVDQLFGEEFCLSTACPLTSYLYPHQIMLQPSATASDAIQLLDEVAAAATEAAEAAEAHGWKDMVSLCCNYQEVAFMTAARAAQ